MIGVDCPTFIDFDRMVKETKPETVIVTTKDATHDRFIIRVMELGCDALTEKPMTTDEKKRQAILDAEKKYGKKTTVTFNYRYSAIAEKTKEILLSGVISVLLIRTPRRKPLLSGARLTACRRTQYYVAHASW